jgi:hypothetical protein
MMSTVALAVCTLPQTTSPPLTVQVPPVIAGLIVLPSRVLMAWRGLLAVRPEIRDRELLDRDRVRLIAVPPATSAVLPSGPVVPGRELGRAGSDRVGQQRAERAARDSGHGAPSFLPATDCHHICDSEPPAARIGPVRPVLATGRFRNSEAIRRQCVPEYRL